VRKLIGAAVAVFIAGPLILYIVLHRSPAGPVAPPKPPGPAAPGEIVDATEEFVFELDRVVDLQRLALSQFAFSQLLEAFGDEFEGDTLLGDADETLALERPWLKVHKRGPKPSKRADLVRQWKAVSAEFEAVLSSRHKVSKARRDGADAASATTAMELEVATKTGRLMLTDTYETALKRREGRWVVTSQKRASGKAVRGVGPGLTRAWNVDVAPGIACHGCAYRTPVLQLGGIAAGDYDNDGRPDLFVQRVGTPVLLHNDGDGKFTDVTKAAGLESPSVGAGALWIDTDNDGRLDLLATALCSADHCGPGCAVRLWHNDGNGRFTESTDKAGLRTHGQCYSACAADIDRDGRLDVFVVRYGDPHDPSGHLNYGPMGGSWLDGREAERDLLFVQQADGTFRESGRERGVDDPGWGLACAFVDPDDDGAPDLFVANDFGPDKYFRNKGDGRFEDATPQDAGGPGFSMGVTPIDYDGDGAVDVYVSEMYSTAGNRVLDNSKDLPAALAEKLRRAARGNTMLRTEAGGLKETPAGNESKGGWAWSAAPFDIDNDGRPDLYVANGFLSGRSRLDL
jgi:hypothetical protein